MQSKNTYLSDSLNGMAQGLFCSLIMGVFFKQIGYYFDIKLMGIFGQFAQYMLGPAIAVGTAVALKANTLGILSALIAGFIGSGGVLLNGNQFILKIGDPISAYLAAIIAVEISKKLFNKTRLNIIVVPFISILVAGTIGYYLQPYITGILGLLGNMINKFTEMQPFFMGILISLSMGIILTLPISSAALSMALGLSGLAAGAATIGCCCHTLGFAVASYKDNKIGGFIAQGLGTSMIQIPNIVKKPIIALPAIISSIILGPVGTIILKVENNKIGAGMGTSGLIGPLSAIDTMGKENIFKIMLAYIILPILVNYIITVIMRRKNIIIDGDMKL